MAKQRKPLITINDDRGNPLNIPSIDSDAAYGKNKYLIVTDSKSTPADLYIAPEKLDQTTQLPVEYGNVITNNLEAIDTNERLKRRKEHLDKFYEGDENKKFIHNLDKEKIPTPVQENGGNISMPDLSTIYLGSFVSTLSDNEDPTILGYDIEIIYNSSPLFNGAVEDFITSQYYSDITEIQSRLQIISDFKEQFFKFFKTDTPSSTSNGIEKAYYLRKISGLDRLVESNTNSETNKSFIDYGKDVIGLNLYEDVTQNMGYLATLYKSLSWSRINGKQVIPPNLLRFNVNINISEVRNYNRIVNNGSPSLSVLADLISKYKYTLYECQLFFPKMPHGSDIDMTSPALLEGFDIIFDYKYSSMRFEKYTPDLNNLKQINYNFIDNNLEDVKQVKTNDTNSISADGNSIEAQQKIMSYNLIDTLNIVNGTDNDAGALTGIDILINSNKTNPADASPFAKLKKGLINAGINEVNRRILTQARLLNRTLDNIRNSIPYAGRMSEPTNIYKTDQQSLETDIANSVRNFVGQSIKGLFGNG